MEFIDVNAEPLLLKGVKKIYYVRYPKKIYISDIRDAWIVANQVAYKISQILGLEEYTVDFKDNEDIGTDYILYRFRIYARDRHLASIRFVTKENALYMIVVTTSLT